MNVKQVNLRQGQASVADGDATTGLPFFNSINKAKTGHFVGKEWFPDCHDGGLDRYFYEMLVSMAAMGMEGTAMVSAAARCSLGGVTVQGMARTDAPVWQRWAGARMLARKAISDGVDFVNAHFALYAAPWLDRLPQTIPLVVNFQGPWADEMQVEAGGNFKKRMMGRAAYWIERRVYRRADRCITLSAAFRDLLNERYGVPLERIRVVPGGVNLENYLRAPERSVARMRLGWPLDRPILLSLRRLARRMGLDLLIDALAAVRIEFPNALLLIGGKGPERDRLQAKVEALGLERNVRLIGFVPETDLAAAYAAADFTVVPTTALEGFGLITVESLASGTPVLGTRVGATPEILEPLSPELLFDEATAPAMSRKIEAVLKGAITPPDRETCQAHARHYGWNHVSPQLLGVFEEAIDEKKVRR